MDLTLHVWRQKGPNDKGKLNTYKATDISPDMSFLEMLDVVNEGLIHQGIEPIAFDHDCREGICGTCSQVINGDPHGPQAKTTVCQLHMRQFKDGDEIYIEPWRSRAFPVIRDLVVDRGAMDRLVQAGGYVSVSTGGVPDANAILIPKDDAETAMDAAECIGCGACVAACPNGSAMLFVAAKVGQLAKLPQGRTEAASRVCTMTDAMLKEGFGNCSNHYDCEAACPKGISVKFIAQLNREYLMALPKAGKTKA
ncbi:succinate dehydrogenase/fumarate reductase, iron-sulfur protein [Syntrophotalea carbinolica DSM 2380]|uniref:Succinate dehydrogenase/fumarate reductase, iron-sulfur protein n=1 Tax=Syntrophotalea carbinolica (strain DSM 2380 / NBRC 103641 / GraBd1) TaxID=338963 RepID=Q3A7E0_SYNC1|nr:succinate dehydrogenase/fumarate reductase iron-sulfur subunit [Syntrophotalea carbinolica]ABA87704.1 succinate dehydrogenase/fumarate reductase, iron-sulfur protein [Syntrophotalea carbinolica DSM 2380]